MANYAKDEARIREIVEQMFAAISWSGEKAPDFGTFSGAVRKDAVLVPAARPVSPTDIDSFVGRMSGMYDNGSMKTFDERANKTIVKVFGNLAVAIGSYHAQFDGGPIGRGANGFLFVRNEGDWQIAAMGWDSEDETKPLPADLV